jgi:hypothetical protein
MMMDTLEADPAVRVVVFDSADEEYFIAHFDVRRGGDLPGPGPTGLPAWPDLATFVDRLARFERPALAAAKAQINKRAGVPSGDDLVEAVTVFRQSSTWPGTQQRVADALARGLQQRGDFELRQGTRLGPRRLTATYPAGSPRSPAHA